MSIRHCNWAPLVLIVLLVWQVAVQLVAAMSWGHDSWQITEWLINYDGGFVRRGLAGECFQWLGRVSGVEANYWVIGVSLLCYGALLAWLLRCATPAFPAVLILSCVVMGMPGYQDSIIRKDCLGLLLLLGCLRFGDRARSRLMGVLMIDAFGMVAVLIHEAWVFYSMGALIGLRLQGGKNSGFTAMGRRSLWLLPIAGCVTLVTVCHGTPEVARAINDSWVPLWLAIDPGVVDVGTPMAAIAAIGWTTREGLAMTAGLLDRGIYQPVCWALVFIVSFGIVVAFAGRRDGVDSENGERIRVGVASILVMQLAFVSPLFVLGIDYGRWLFLWVASSIMLFACGRAAPEWLENVVARVFSAMQLRVLLERWPVRDWYLLGFGVPVLWSARHFLTANPVGRLAEPVFRCLGGG